MIRQTAPAGAACAPLRGGDPVVRGLTATADGRILGGCRRRASSWIATARFRPEGASARLLAAIRRGGVRLVSDEATRRQTGHNVRKIPPLPRMPIADLYRPEDRHGGPTDPAAFAFVPDPDDRKLLALAAAAGAAPITLDQHLLGLRRRTGVPILTPSELVRRLELRGDA